LRACLSEGASNGIYKPPHLIGSGTLLIGQTALTEDRSVEPSLARRATVSMQDLRRFGLSAGDILIARVFATVEGVGRPALVPELGEPAVFESNMMRLRVSAATIRPRLLFEWLKGDVSRRHIAGRANASNQVSVNQGVLYPLLVPVPPLDEQDRMLARIEAADARRVADLATLSKLRAQKLGLMQDLLTGKVRAPLAETVPA
jgi:type I restriction enzyme S subunit